MVPEIGHNRSAKWVSAVKIQEPGISMASVQNPQHFKKKKWPSWKFEHFTASGRSENTFPHILHDLGYILPPKHTNHSTSFADLLPSRSTKLSLYKSLIRPKLLYCSQVWRPHKVKDIKNSERIQRRATKFFLQDYLSSYRDRLITLNLLPLSQQHSLFLLKPCGENLELASCHKFITTIKNKPKHFSGSIFSPNVIPYIPAPGSYVAHVNYAVVKTKSIFLTFNLLCFITNRMHAVLVCTPSTSWPYSISILTIIYPCISCCVVKLTIIIIIISRITIFVSYTIVSPPFGLYL